MQANTFGIMSSQYSDMDYLDLFDLSAEPAGRVSYSTHASNGAETLTDIESEHIRLLLETNQTRSKTFEALCSEPRLGALALLETLKSGMVSELELNIHLMSSHIWHHFRTQAYNNPIQVTVTSLQNPVIHITGAGPKGPVCIVITSDCLSVANPSQEWLI